VSRSLSPDLHDVLLGIQSSLDSLAERILAIESADQARIGTVSMTLAPPPPTSTKGKAHAQATPVPSKAKPAKKERPTKKAPIPSEGLPLHLAQTFPQEGKSNRHLMTVAIPDATVAHIIRQGGKGLKQLHDISGARVSAYMLKSGLRDERHVSICGTDEQISDALVVLGKRLTWKHVRSPTTKKTVPGSSVDWADPAPPHVASVTYCYCKGNPLRFRRSPVFRFRFRLPPAFRFRSRHLVSLPQRLRSNDILRHPLLTRFRSRSHDVA